VTYLGSIERTSLVAREKENGYVLLAVNPAGDRGAALREWTLHRGRRDRSHRQRGPRVPMPH
jgi:hypothetical protein